MDLKKKYEEAKTKIKDHAPAIIAATSAGVAGILFVVNRRLKSELNAQIESWDDRLQDNFIHLTDESTARLKDGEVAHLMNPFEDFCLTLQKHDHPEED